MGDLEHTNAVHGALAGGVLWGLARLYVAAFSPNPPRKRDLTAAAVESSFAIVAAGIGGYYVAPAFNATLHIERTDLAGLSSVIIGLGFWQSIPALRALAAAVIPNTIATRIGLKPNKAPEAA